jgi:protocatechuate 3,4-dioxygenase beta subunit
MENNDLPVGRILKRREVLKLFGVTSGALLLGGLASHNTAQTETNTLPSCVVRPELTEGPYFVDERLNRSDIRSDPNGGEVSAGVPLALKFIVSQVGATCAALEGARVDVWHCDALGRYSDVRDRSFDTRGQQFLRGYQLTSPEGLAQFITIYPGWYPGRAVHIHFKIRTASGYEFTSQLFFDDTLSDKVYLQEPYFSRGRRTLLNKDDNIYKDGGNQLLLAVTETSEGYAAIFDVGLNL